MKSAASRYNSPLTGSGSCRRTLGDLVAGLLLAMGMAVATWWLLGLPATYLLTALIIYATMALLVVVSVPADLPGPGLGPANRVTLGRAALAIPVVALCVPPIPLGVLGSWWVIFLGTTVMILDGVDGAVARRTRSQSAFGARFDMEFDAALIMALAVLVWATGRAGAWCLLIGLMRYVFLAAGWILPQLRAELPESYRRKVVCVVQGAVLLIALGPIIPDLMAVVVVATGLALLLYSFSVDVLWALMNSGR